MNHSHSSISFFDLDPCLNNKPRDVNTSEDQSYREFYEWSQILTGLVFYPVLCVVGLLGNTFAILVVSQRKITSTSVFLIALALADILKLLNDCLYFIVSILFQTHPTHANRMMGYLYPFSHYVLNQSVCVSSWLTVCIGTERYLLVCHIAKAKEICIVKRSKVISVTVFLLMSFLALPSAFRYTRVTVVNEYTNKSYYDVTLTRLGCNDLFMTYYVWMINLLRSVIPLIILTTLNACIIYKLRRQSRQLGKRIYQSKNRITLMLVAVIIVFMVCITPDAIMSTVFNFGYVEANYLVKGLREYSDTLLSLNSAVNFIIYCRFNHSFRVIFKQVLCHCCLWQRNKLFNRNRAATSVESPLYELELMNKSQGQSTSHSQKLSVNN